MSDGYSEVADGAQPVVASVQLSAPIIDAAYQALLAATRKKLAAEMHRLDVTVHGIDPERLVVMRLEAQAEYEVQLAKIEVDRVTTLMNFIQTESILKAGGQ